MLLLYRPPLCFSKTFTLRLLESWAICRDRFFICLFVHLFLFFCWQKPRSMSEQIKSGWLLRGLHHISHGSCNEHWTQTWPVFFQVVLGAVVLSILTMLAAKRHICHQCSASYWHHSLQQGVGPIPDGWRWGWQWLYRGQSHSSWSWWGRDRRKQGPLLSMSPIFRHSSHSFMSDSLKAVLPQASGTGMAST